ncbi:hypothetical protein RB595_006328 [Gaeumannomyces hyphopodioides]
MAAAPSNAGFEVAIVGGGIVGVIMAIGLLKRQIPVRIYEQSRAFRELGAGLAFTANALKCMSLLDPAIVAAVYAVATPNGEDADKPNDYMRWHDGYTWDWTRPAEEQQEDPLLFLLSTGYKGFQGCHRAHLLDELIKSVPPGIVHFGKRLVGYKDGGQGEKLVLEFQDGTTASADLVVGCDGIKSKVRQLLNGADNPASYPHYSHKVAYRALIPMERVVPLLGRFKAYNQHMHTGPGARVLHYPVAGGSVLNVVAFVTDPADWPLGNYDVVGSMTAPATKAELEAAFKGWGPTVTNLIGLLPDKMDKWAIFDTYDHPLASYVGGRVCLAGDAAHATSPHHGAGAGIGVEDALALATVLEMVRDDVAKDGTADVPRMLEDALRVYDEVRPPRGNWLVQSSRQVCDIYEWTYPATGKDWDKCLGEITARSHKLWYFDIDDMLDKVDGSFRKMHPAPGDGAGATVTVAVGLETVPPVV